MTYEAVVQLVLNTIFGPEVVQPNEKESDNDKLGPGEGEEVECCGEAATTGDCCGNPECPRKKGQAMTEQGGVERFEGHPERECGNHHTLGARAWCGDCSEYCSPSMPCLGCEAPALRRKADRDDALQALLSEAVEEFERRAEEANHNFADAFDLGVEGGYRSAASHLKKRLNELGAEDVPVRGGADG